MSSGSIPCYCRDKRDASQFEWKQYRDQMRLIAWQELHNKIARSEYILHKWGNCYQCVVNARRRVAIIAIFLAKLGVLTDRSMGDKVDNLDLT